MKKILVIGDVILDRNITCKPERVSRESPLLIYKKTYNDNEYMLGGAGNVVANLIGLEQTVDVYWPKGSDEYSSIIQEKLHRIHVVNYPISINNPTIVKTRIFSDNKQIFRYDEHKQLSDNEKIDMSFLDNIKSNNYEYAILSDYNSNFFTINRMQEIIKYLNSRNIKVIVDPHNNDWSIYKNVYLITPNFDEFISSSNGEEILNNSSSINNYAIKLMMQHNIKNILVTRSEKGMILCNRNGIVINLHSKTLDVIDVTGAGDTVISTIAWKLNEGKEWSEAIQSSNIAASIVIQKTGVVAITKNELLLNHNSIASKIFNFSNKKEMINLKNTMVPNDLVFTNGGFDIIHYGHISYLLESSSMNKKLIIGLNSDSSIKKIKGENRPINNQEERALTIAALPFVTAVIIFDQETAIDLIKYFKPYIYTKGSDYETKTLPEFKYAKKIVYIPYKKGFSTTKIISKMKR